MYRRPFVVISAACLLCCSSVGGVEFTYPKGTRISGLSDWPPGLRRCADVESRVYGHSNNDKDFHYYGGDTAEFNRFLAAYSKLKLARHDLVLLPGRGEIEVTAEDGKGKVKLPYDWMLGVTPGGGSPLKSGPKYHVTIRLYLGGQVQRGELKIPPGVQVDNRIQPDPKSKSG